MIDRLVVFGASGDLTGRFLLPALAQLAAAQALPEDFRVVGAATKTWDDDRFRQHASEQLKLHATDVPDVTQRTFVDTLRYQKVDVTDPASVATLVRSVRDDTGRDQQDERAVAAYLALPTALIPPTVTALGGPGLSPGSRVAIEKPFGEDLPGAIALNGLLARTFGTDWEQVVFRVDHALGMPTLHNVLAMRFDNSILQTLWSSHHIEEIELLWEESLALEGRAAFYDHAGALKDVMQNHMMQLLSFAAMEPPDGSAAHPAEASGGWDLGSRKIDALRSVRALTTAQVVSSTRRARYTAGLLTDSGGGHRVPSYTSEPGVDPSRDTETFAEVVLELDSPRWEGTTFRLRAAKALAERRKGIRVRFRPVHDVGSGAGPRPAANALWIGIDGPNDLTLTLSGLSSGPSSDLAPVELSGPPPRSALMPYAHVLLNLLEGRNDLSVGAREVEEGWRILTPVREAWDSGLVPMEHYAAGSAGPAAPAVDHLRAIHCA